MSDVGQDEREAMIEDQINACPGCGDRYNPRRSDCEVCIAVVDERIAARQTTGSLISSDFTLNEGQTVAIVGDASAEMVARIKALLSATAKVVVVDDTEIPEGTRATHRTPVVFFDEWPDTWPIKESEPEGPRDRHGHISGLQNGRKHNKKKGKR